MVRRVCRKFGSKKGIIVINDEAHHCYRQKADGAEYVLKGDERKEAEKRDEEARVWISGLEAVKAKLGIKLIYDLSATPFFLAPLIARAREALGLVEFAKAEAAGRGLSYEAAIAETRAWLEHPPNRWRFTLREPNDRFSRIRPAAKGTTQEFPRSGHRRPVASTRNGL